MALGDQVYAVKSDPGNYRPAEPSIADVMLCLHWIDKKLEALYTHLIVQEAAQKTEGDYLTVREAAAEFKLSTTVLYRMTTLHHRRGRSIRFRRSQLARHLSPDPFRAAS